MDVELRDYVVPPGRLDDWIRAWSHGVMPIRERWGLHLLGAWANRPHDRFVWVLGHYGPGRLHSPEAARAAHTRSGREPATVQHDPTAAR
jgi:hypothetical protein